MSKPKSRLGILIFIPAFFVFCFGTCDHTRLSGEIIMDKEQIHIGDTLYLKLKVPDELENIHGVMWQLQADSSDATIKYRQLKHDSLKQIEKGFIATDKEDREAIFVAKEKGIYPVFVDGFYKQTNPQPITDTIIIVE